MQGDRLEGKAVEREGNEREKNNVWGKTGEEEYVCVYVAFCIFCFVVESNGLDSKMGCLSVQLSKIMGHLGRFRTVNK